MNLSPDASDSNEIALELHREALDALETAQHSVADAMELISSIDGLGDEWSMLGVLYETVKQHWYHLNRSRNDIR